jgi:hypothetical protein
LSRRGESPEGERRWSRRDREKRSGFGQRVFAGELPGGLETAEEGGRNRTGKEPRRYRSRRIRPGAMISPWGPGNRFSMRWSERLIRGAGLERAN